MPSIELAEYYVDLMQMLAGGQLAYDYEKEEYHPLDNDDDDYILVQEFLEDGDYVSGLDVEGEYLLIDRMLSPKMFTIYLKDVLHQEGECICELWSDSAIFRIPDVEQQCSMNGYLASRLFESISDLINEAS